MVKAWENLVGQSGRQYLIKRVLQKKLQPPQNVYLASAGKKDFIVKEISASTFKYRHDMYKDLQGSSNLRLLQGTIRDQSMFVFRYFKDDLLSLSNVDLPIAVTKRILKDTLRGLAALHDRDIVHTDIKANSIMIDWNNSSHGISVKLVELTDIEDAAYVPPGSDIVGGQVGNQLWRSPEAHAEGRVNKYSDMFSFGIVCIFAVLKRLIFTIDEEELVDDVEPLSIILERQISFFADLKGMEALLKHLGDSPWCQVLEILRDSLDAENPRKPFSLRKDVNGDFEDLVGGLTNFDPAKRLTAREALLHKWFTDV